MAIIYSESREFSIPPERRRKSIAVRCRMTVNVERKRSVLAIYPDFIYITHVEAHLVESLGDALRDPGDLNNIYLERHESDADAIRLAITRFDAIVQMQSPAADAPAAPLAQEHSS